LDRHGTLERYTAAKAKILANQGDADWLVVNADDPQVLAMVGGSRAQRLPFALDRSIPDGITLVDDVITRRMPSASVPLVPRSAVKLLGRHLLQDVLAAVAIGVIVGATPEAMTRAVAAFEGLEHTLEPVRRVGGVQFINDSKATNLAAARHAIESFGPGLVPIVGGRFKGGDWRVLQDGLVQRARALVAIGEARPQIVEALGGSVPVHEADSLAEAVRMGFTLAAPRGTVLLAPACASFDMFQDYAERGRRFKEEVERLAGSVTEIGEQ
jgi:UDP-N-acetylmuramoylalanine--D-glutamate ligase